MFISRYLERRRAIARLKLIQELREIYTSSLGRYMLYVHTEEDFDNLDPHDQHKIKALTDNLLGLDIEQLEVYNVLESLKR